MTGERGERTVLVVEDDAMVRDWLRLALRGSEFRVVGEAPTAASALELIERRRPALVLVDYRLPSGRGTDFVKELRKAGAGIPAVVMTANPERGLNELTREAGAQGTVLKSGSRDDVIDALRAVAAGGVSFDVRHPRRAPGEGALSPREKEVLRLVADGKTNIEIAEQLSIGVETVKTILGRACRKLGVRRRAQAVAAAHAQGLL